MSVSQEMFHRQCCIFNILSCVKSPDKICLGDFVCICKDFACANVHKCMPLMKGSEIKIWPAVSQMLDVIMRYSRAEEMHSV